MFGASNYPILCLVQVRINFNVRIFYLGWKREVQNEVCSTTTTCTWQQSHHATQPPLPPSLHTWPPPYTTQTLMSIDHQPQSPCREAVCLQSTSVIALRWVSCWTPVPLTFGLSKINDLAQVQVQVLHVLQLMVLFSWTQQQRSAPVGEMNGQILQWWVLIDWKWVREKWVVAGREWGDDRDKFSLLDPMAETGSPVFFSQL